MARRQQGVVYIAKSMGTGESLLQEYEHSTHLGLGGDNPPTHPPTHPPTPTPTHTHTHTHTHTLVVFFSGTNNYR